MQRLGRWTRDTKGRGFDSRPFRFQVTDWLIDWLIYWSIELWFYVPLDTK